MQGLLKFLLAGSPDWTVRRRMAIAIQGLGAWMIAYGALWAKAEIAGMLITNGTALSGSVLTVYIIAAGTDDELKRRGSAAGKETNAGG